jgi:hypothetical protein
MMDGITMSVKLGRDGFVIAIRDEEDGLIFWNNADGFGTLDFAAIFAAPPGKLGQAAGSKSRNDPTTRCSRLRSRASCDLICSGYPS